LVAANMIGIPPGMIKVMHKVLQMLEHSYIAHRINSISINYPHS
jgi:hypothetical protein